MPTTTDVLAALPQLPAAICNKSSNAAKHCAAPSAAQFASCQAAAAKRSSADAPVGADSDGELVLRAISKQLRRLGPSSPAWRCCRRSANALFRAKAAAVMEFVRHGGVHNRIEQAAVVAVAVGLLYENMTQARVAGQRPHPAWRTPTACPPPSTVPSLATPRPAFELVRTEPAMKEISKAEFNSHKIMRQKTLAERLAGRKVSEEKQWFAHGKLLGVVLLDLIDNDWSFVVLSKQGRGYRTHDLGVKPPHPSRGGGGIANGFRSHRRGGGGIANGYRQGMKHA